MGGRRGPFPAPEVAHDCWCRRCDHARSDPQPPERDRRGDGDRAAEGGPFGDREGGAGRDGGGVRRARPDDGGGGCDPGPGDVYSVNDPDDGGTHLPDVTILVPVFHEGQVVALSATMAHHQDIGGKSPGSTPPDAGGIFAEGLRIPLLKLYRAGRPNETFFALLRANVRLPEMFEGDLGAQLAACNTGARLLREMVAE